MNVSAQPHTFIAGGYGSGKTTLVRNIINHCVGSPEWGAVTVSGQEDETFNPSAVNVGSHMANLAFLKDAVREMGRRYKQIKPNDPNTFRNVIADNARLLFVIEDVNKLVADRAADPDFIVSDKNELLMLLDQLLRTGRAVGMHVLLTSQEFMEYVDTSRIQRGVMMNCQNKVIMGRPSIHNYAAVHGERSDFLANPSLGDGELFIRGDSSEKFTVQTHQL